jgi:hypothetical protein
MSNKPQDKPIKRVERIKEGRNTPRDQSVRPTPPPKPPDKKPPK